MSSDIQKDIKENFSETESRMNKSIESLKHNLNGLRTGRASASLLDTVKVEAYGNFTPINQIGSVSAPEARLLVVQIWDKDLVKPTEKAIRDADLGLNPMSEGGVIRVPIPDLTEERRKELVKKGGEYCEMTKVGIRNIRRDSMDFLKKFEKDKKISQDDLKAYSDDIQKITDKHTKNADEILVAKSNEIMKV